MAFKVEFLRGAKFEADDRPLNGRRLESLRCQQLQVELQQAKNSVSAQAMQLESHFRESEMQQMEAMEQVAWSTSDFHDVSRREQRQTPFNAGRRRPRHSSIQLKLRPQTELQSLSKPKQTSV